MRSQNEQQDPLTSPMHRELQLLTEVDETPEVTQRQLSVKFGIALGLTNLLLRNLVQKGYLRVSHATWKRRLYSLTPEGISHKFRLTTTYISRVLDHYRDVRRTLRDQLEVLDVNQESRIAIYGTNEFAELVFLGLREIGIEEIDIFSSGNGVGGRFLGMPIRDPSTFQPQDYDKIVVAMLAGFQEASAELLNRGVLPQDVVTFFPGHEGRVG